MEKRTLYGDQEMPLSSAQLEELERRLQTLDADIKDGVTWEQLKAELEQRLPNPLTIR